VKVALGDAPPLRLAWMRFLLGGLTILAYALWTRRAGLLRYRRHEWRQLWSVGALFALQIGLMNYGQSLTSASHATVLLNAYAVHSVLLAHFFIPGDRLSATTLTGVLVAYAGIVLLFARDFSLHGDTLLGDLVVSASALLLGERIVYMSRAVQTIDPVKLLIGQSAFGTTCFFLASLALESGVPTRYTASLGLALLYQGVVVAGVLFLVNTWMLQIYKPSVLAAPALTTPLFGLVIARGVTGDALTPALLASGVLVALGIGITTWRPRRALP
jgi:drug/metabolite transporter (DMT)-like permease